MMVDSMEDRAPAARTEGRLTWVESLMLRYRLQMNVAVHVFLFALALLAAYLVRFDSGVPGSSARGDWFFGSFLPWLPYFVIMKVIIFGWLKLFRGGWKYSSIRDVANILLALGMHMLAPTVISLPFKLLLFVMVDGWYLITKGLILGYL